MIRRGAPAALAVLVLGGALAGCAGFKTPSFFHKSNTEDKARAAAGQRIPVLTQDVKLTAAPALKGVDFALPDPQPLAAWPNPGGNPTQSVEHVEAAPAFQLAWRRHIGLGDSRANHIMSSPIEAEGKLFVLDGRSGLYALDPQSGHEIWKADLAQHKGRGEDGFGGGVTYGDGAVYMSSGFRFVAAVDAKTGKQLWKTPTDAPVHGAPTYADGKLYVIDIEDQLQAYDAKTGRSLWTYQALEEPARMLIASSPVVNGDEVIAPFASGELIGLSTDNGTELWNRVLSFTNRNNALSEIRDIAGRPVLYRGTVFAGSHAGVVAGVDARTGDLSWSIPTASITTPWPAGDVVYVTDQGGQVLCIARDSGQIYWIRGLNENLRKKFRSIYSGPILASNRLIVVSSRGKTGEAVALNPKTGEMIKSIRLGAPAFITPIAVNGLVYVMTDTGDLVAIR